MFILFLFCISPSSDQDLLLTLCLEITLSGLGEPYLVPEIEPGSVACSGYPRVWCLEHQEYPGSAPGSVFGGA